jgi:spermidine synthase
MRARRVFILLYAASGAAALVYEVTWTRLLTLQLGHTVAAASTVLAAFMGGLALGAWIAGGRPVRNTLRAYAVLELAVAAAALILPVALAASVPALAWAYADGTAPTRFGIVRVAISLILIGLPAAAMGATFPIATTWYARVSADTGLLYAVNTAGAAIGAIGAGFLLIPALGLRATTWVGVALNAVAAAGAWWLSTSLAATPTIDAETAEHAEPSHRTSRKKNAPRVQRALRSKPAASPRLAYAATAISGFTALVYEVAWTRLLALVVGPTTYAFATMAGAFISGLAIGSAIGTRIARRAAQPAVWLALMLVAGALSAIGAAWFAATRMPLLVAAEVADPAVIFRRVIATQAMEVGVLLLPMTLALGATFPLALAVASGATESLGRDAARVYAANTIGAIAGALTAGFALIPRLGLQMTFETAAIVAAGSGVACLALTMRSARGPATATDDRRPTIKNQRPSTKDQRPTTSIQRPTSIIWPSAVAVVALAVILMMPPWDRNLLASGAYKYAPYLAAGVLDSVLRAGRLEYYKEGASGTVSVKRLAGTLSLSIDGKVDASNGGDMLTQRLLGLLPVLLHGKAQDICIIGLGSGVTADSALAPGGVRHADVIEISPQVVEASRLFERENGRVLSNPAVRLIVGDGRSHLLLTPRRYDVIVSEPSNPWMSGVAALFTREFFQAARARLKPGGLLCQWAHTYDISASDLQSIVRTFASVFPQGTMWLVGEGDLLLIGATDESAAAPIERMAREWRVGTASAALTSVGIDDAAARFALLSLFVAGPREIERYGDVAPIQTDDHTVLEYSAPRGIYGRTKDANSTAIRALDAAPPAAVREVFERAGDAAWAARGMMELRAQAFRYAYDSFRRAVTLNSRNVEALAGLSDGAGGSNRLTEERDWLQAIASREPANAAVRIELSRVLAVSGDRERAVEAAAEAMRLTPDDPRAGEQLASVLADAGDADRLTPLADAMVARFPDRPDPLYYRASALFIRGKTDEAIASVRRLTDSHPTHSRAQNLLGAACATLARWDCARAAFEASIRVNPRDPATHVNLGIFHLQSSNPDAAAESFAEALSLDPTSVPARDGLAQARAASPKN